MVLRDDARDLDELASFHDGLAHPVRVAVMRVLRDPKKAPGYRLPFAALRHQVREMAGELDTRNLQYHVSNMQTAGWVAVARVGTEKEVRLIRDGRLVVAPVPEA